MFDGRKKTDQALCRQVEEESKRDDKDRKLRLKSPTPYFCILFH